VYIVHADAESTPTLYELYTTHNIEVPGIPYMAADAEGGSHMEEWHRARARKSQKSFSKF
jgi:hypothetical protein